MRLCLVFCFASLATASLSFAGDVGFSEDFALAKDRTVALKQLIPGTEDYYYYHGLHYLNTEQFEKAAGLFNDWIKRFGETPRYHEIRTRLALLTYDRDAKKTLDFLKTRYGIAYNHLKENPGAVPDLPSALDQSAISRDTLKANSFGRWGLLENFEDGALDWLAADKLNGDRLRNFLQRLTRPDVPDLPALVAQDLTFPNGPGFGGYPVNRMMTRAQLDELLKLRPELLNQVNFVQTYLTKLQPGADSNWRHDPKEARAYFERVLAFARRLNATHNSLKAHAIYQLLVLGRKEGVWDKPLFLEYLALPRMQNYMARRMLENIDLQRVPADLNANWTPFTLFPIVGGDEPLVRSYLKHFLAEADSPREFLPFINDEYLKQLFAETKIEQGLGEPERWASDLPPEVFAVLKNRIDIDFAYTNKTDFAVGDPVVLDLFVKNVPNLIVKIFEINALNYYKTFGREANTDINLDGLVPNFEQSFAYAESPLRRTPRTFAFPQLGKAGVYVIDFIGAGQSSRALVRKGKLSPIVETGPAGQQVTVVDDKHRLVKDAVVWMGGKEYKAAKDGVVLLPFGTAPGRVPVVLFGEGFASLSYIDHQGEAYRLAAGIYVDRESLLNQKLAAVVVRPGLFLNNLPVSTQLLTDVTLRIVAGDQDGILTTQEIKDVKLFEDRETVHPFRVPARLVSLAVTLQGKLKTMTTSQEIVVADSANFGLNGINRTDKIEDLHFLKFGKDYFVELLGRTGEVRPDRAVHVSLKHRDFKELVQTNLKTDAKGRIKLGPLVDIQYVTATDPEGTAHTWNLPTDEATRRQVMHAKAGDTVTLPYTGVAGTPSRDELALFAVNNATITADRFAAIAVKDGMIELKGLEAGDYDLTLKREGRTIRIRVAAGDLVADYVVGAVRQLELPKLKPVQIASIKPVGDNVAIQLTDASPFTRVHVFATRYEPAYSAFGHLSKVRDSELQGFFPGFNDSIYITGRNIGDEYRYTIERKQQKKYPGNMLERPQLLLNPWALRTTATNEQLALEGTDYGVDRIEDVMTPLPPHVLNAPKTPEPVDDAAFANLDYLADSTGVVLNLVPDKDGLVKVPKNLLAPHSSITVVAVDPLNTVSKNVSFAEEKTDFLDLRLIKGLDPKEHFTQQKTISILPVGQAFTIPDAGASRFETYDSVGKLYALYSTLLKDPKLAEFSFIATWPTLKIEQKRTLYSKNACHELNFFLFKKDPEFFKAVVKPYLANKKDKTFLDRWLLEEDLAEYVKPWNYGRLNLVERVLLGQRLAGEPAKTARYVNDLARLLPPSLDRDNFLFDTSVKGGELDALSGKPGEGKKRLEDTMKEQAGVEKDAKGANAAKPDADFRFGDSPAAQGKSGPTVTNGGFGGGGFGGVLGGAPAGAMGGRSGSAQRDGVTKREQERKSALDSKADDGKDRELYMRKLREAADKPNALYRKVDPTKEWAEDNYYHLPIRQQVGGLVTVSPFWNDYARNEGKGPFLTRNIAEPSRNFTEAMFALALIDLPFAPGNHEVKYEGVKLTFTPASPAIVFHEEVRNGGELKKILPILVSQNFFKADDRYTDVNGERLDKFVTEEFVVQTVYGSQVVVTNPSPSRQKLSVLVQIPVGAVPLAGAWTTKTILLDLEPYRTQTIDTLFYFPFPGQYPHYPVQVAKNETPVAAGNAVVFNVASKPSKLDTTSWGYVSQNGTNEQVLTFLETANVQSLNLEKIAFRMRDVGFYENVLKLLQSRHAYNQTLWSYSLLHNDAAAARQFLAHIDQLAVDVSGPIDTPIYVLDPVARFFYEHLEYKPLVNARAYSLGKRRQIVNDSFNEQYHRFMHLLSYHRELDDDDKMAVTYYMLLQDRVEEALGFFGQVNKGKVKTALQYDYFAAYLTMFGDDPSRARDIAAAYAEHPVDRWRNAFQTVLNQLDEIDGKGPKVADADDREQKQTALAAKEPAFDFKLDDKSIRLSWQNLEAVTVNYYLMDVELLFSRNPFVQQTGGDRFAMIRPNMTQVVLLPKGDKFKSIPLPAELAKQNVLVEVTAAGKTRALPYYANAMTVKLTENYGQLQALGTGGKPLAKVYVKAYVRTADGQVKFHKDGYTDHRGRFDYATVSMPDGTTPVKYAVLALSDEFGAVIQEANPPQQ